MRDIEEFNVENYKNRPLIIDGTPEFNRKEVPCPKCKSTKTEIRNYNTDFHDGDLHCGECGEYLRMWDNG